MNNKESWKKYIKEQMKERDIDEIWLIDYVKQLLAEQKEAFKKMIVEETVICHKDGMPTSRLTALFMRVSELK